MVYRTLHNRLILDHVNREACALGERAELVVDGLHLDSVERNERRLTRTLVAHVLHHNIFVQLSVWQKEGTLHLYAVNGGPLLIYNDCIDVTAQDDRDGTFVLPLSGLAQVNQSATHTCTRATHKSG